MKALISILVASLFMQANVYAAKCIPDYEFEQYGNPQTGQSYFRVAMGTTYVSNPSLSGPFIEVTDLSETGPPIHWKYKSINFSWTKPNRFRFGRTDADHIGYSIERYDGGYYVEAANNAEVLIPPDTLSVNRANTATSSITYFIYARFKDESEYPPEQLGYASFLCGRLERSDIHIQLSTEPSNLWC